jgi:hypothetical protein
VPCLVAGMIGGADSIDDLGLLRHGALPALFGGIRAPSTLGSFLRSFTWGNVLQLEKVNLWRSEIRFGPVTCGFSVGQAACVYSLIRPPRTGLRWIRAVSRSVTVARGMSRSASGTC